MTTLKRKLLKWIANSQLNSQHWCFRANKHKLKNTYKYLKNNKDQNKNYIINGSLLLFSLSSTVKCLGGLHATKRGRKSVIRSWLYLCVVPQPPEIGKRSEMRRPDHCRQVHLLILNDNIWSQQLNTFHRAWNTHTHSQYKNNKQSKGWAKTKYFAKSTSRWDE